MKILVLGASGATGRLLVEQLLNHNHSVIAIVRNIQSLPKDLIKNEHLKIIEANVLELDDDSLSTYVDNCEAIVSCLGHNLSWKGIYGHPRRLVTEATQKICNIIKSNKNAKPKKYLLMNTVGNSNRDLNEASSFSQRLIIGLIRFFLPPHVDNEKASDYLRSINGSQNKIMEWVVVRPNSLIDEENISEYKVYKSPIGSAIFDSGKTSRINVASFMIELITNNTLWQKWKGQMPVIYNK